MPENQDPNVIYLGGVIITALAGVVVALWKVIDNMRKERNKQSDNHAAAIAARDKAHLEKIEKTHKVMLDKADESHANLAAALKKSYSELIDIVKEGAASQLNGHETLKEEIKEIDEKVDVIDKKVMLIEEKLKDK